MTRVGWRRRATIPVLSTVVLSLVFVTPARTAAPLFTDGFESGSLTSWTFTTGLKVGSAAVHQGTWSARATATRKPAWAYRSLASTKGNLYARTWFRVATRSTPVTLLRFRTTDGAPIVSVGIAKSGKLTIQNGRNGRTTTSPIHVSNRSWHEVQLHAVIAGSKHTDVWFDGAPVPALSLGSSLGSAPIGRVQVGENLPTRTFDITFDDVAIDTSFLTNEPPGDNESPTTPTGLTVPALSSGMVQLNWSASGDDVGVAGYTIYRSDPANPVRAPVGSTNGPTATSFTDDTVSPDSDYTYAVDAFDAASNRSLQSSPVAVHTPGSSASDMPNIVIILTDDQPYDTLGHMNQVRSELVDEGVTFRNGFVSDPLCCPSRASILRGQYSHTTGLYDVAGPYGGWKRAHNQNLESSTLATWLDAAGYRTGLVGKYLNGYNTPSFVAPGWDYWRATTDGYYGYQVSENGVPRTYGSEPADYKTTVLSGYADAFIRSTPASTPLFLYLTPVTPHMPFTPEPKYKTDPRCNDATNTDSPAFNEADVSDKPTYVRNETLTPELVTELGTSIPQKQCRALLSVDDMVGNVMQAMTDTGRIGETFFVFTTDNGLMNGEHRQAAKKVPYEGSIHVPFVVRYDPVTAAGAPKTDAHLVVNIDIAPTIMDLLDIPVTPGCPQPAYSATCTGSFDGESFLRLLDGTVSGWRNAFLIEHFESSGSKPAFCGIRTGIDKLVRYHTGEEEFYDLAADPDELRNLMAGTLTSGQQARYDVLYQRLFGAGGLCNPAPPGYPLP